MIYVTHDQVEAMTMADKIVVLQDGIIEQVGSPLELYRAPASIFVAGFIGSPKMNVVEGSEVSKHGAHSIGVRPEHLSVSTDSGTWQGTVGVSEHLGSDTFFHVQVNDIAEPLTVRAQGDVNLSYQSTIFLTPDPEQIHKFNEQGICI